MRRSNYLTWMLLAVSVSAHAGIPIDGLYSTAFGGAAFIPGNISVGYNNALVNQSNYMTGFDAGGALGYKAAFWRYEAEVTYINAQLNKIAINNQVTNDTKRGYNQDVTAFVNLVYDTPYREYLMLQPYIGAGIGYAWVQNNFNTPRLTSYNNQELSFNTNNYAFAYQAMVGLNFHFSEAYSLFAGYRYVGTTHLDNNGSTFQAHLVNAGITYRYDSCQYK